MTYRLYRTPIPEDALQDQRGGARAELSRLTQLQGQGLVEQLGTQSGDLTLDLQYRGKYADRLQLELREVIESPTVATMPLAPAEGTSTVDAYYAVELVSNAGAISAQSEALQRLQATLVREGTHQSHRQALSTGPSQPQPGHPFGNDTTKIVAIPASATRVEAIDATSDPTARESVPIESIATAEHGDVARIDLSTIAIEDPTIIYRPADYDQIGDVDVGVWDTYGAADIADAEGIIQWQRCFSVEHDFRGAAVLENGLLRVTIDHPTDDTQTATLQAERYDADAGAWTAVDLPEYDTDLATDWAPVDVDLVKIGQARVRAQVTFEAVAGTNAGDTYTLDMALFRGWDDLLITIPESVSDPVPADLEALLDPIASARVVDLGVEQTTVSRDGVRL
ncbi:hypothetical protein [Halobellus rufus]|uniref:hypothetical protein n=1 Tax=Halobellus rufus TaxID=1448860 RepID=UPI0006791273|nr:hypothetical protein [Halobellus rufus]